MTQHEAIIEFCKEFGSILPAKQHGFEYKGTFLGSELSKRARELRKKGVLRSEKDGKFERFYLVDNHFTIENKTVVNGFSPCCYSSYKFGTHDPNCQTLKIKENRLF